MASSHKARRRKARRDEKASTPAPHVPAAAQPTLWTPALIVIVLVGVALRVYYIRQPMRYDESVTYLYFAGQPWATAVSSYIYPNNHVFHTLLAKACIALLGNEPWVIRLPAFLAGVAMIPLTYAVGRRLFGTTAAYIAAALVAASGALVFYSTNARGYTMIGLATLMLGDLLLRLRDRPSIAMWSGVVLVTALGLWTVPVMLYPAGGLILWFILSALRGDTSAPRSDLARAAVAIVAIAAVTLVMYAPIIADAGLTVLTGNSFVRATTWRVFFRQVSASVGPVLSSWTVGYPIVMSAVLGVCVVAGLVAERSASRLRVSIAASMYVWCAAVLLVTHRAPFYRVWLFLVAPLALLAGHGLVRLASSPALGTKRLDTVSSWASVGLAAALSLIVLVSRDVETSRDTGTLRDAERIAFGFSGGLRPGDRVVAPLPSNAPLAYYFLRAGLDTTYLSAVPRDSSRVYLVVNTGEGFTLNSRLRDPLLRSYRRAKLMVRYPSAEVYQLF